MRLTGLPPSMVRVAAQTTQDGSRGNEADHKCQLAKRGSYRRHEWLRLKRLRWKWLRHHWLRWRNQRALAPQGGDQQGQKDQPKTQNAAGQKRAEQHRQTKESRGHEKPGTDDDQAGDDANPRKGRQALVQAFPRGCDNRCGDQAEHAAQRRVNAPNSRPRPAASPSAM